MVLNGQSVAFILQGKYPEAEAALSEALEKDPNNPETLVNLIVLSQLTGKQPEVARALKLDMVYGRVWGHLAQCYSHAMKIAPYKEDPSSSYISERVSKICLR